MRNMSLGLLALCLSTTPLSAQNSSFHRGTAIPEFGQIATIETDMPIPQDTKFNISYDLAKGASIGEINRSFNTAARFINMHIEAGVRQDNIKLAIVVHGTASLDLTDNAFYKTKYEGADNANKKVVAALLAAGVEIIICGQSAAAHGISKSDLLPGVKMSLSAMTAHALLQQQGYTLNPF